MASTNIAPEKAFSEAAEESHPVLETVFQMHLDTFANCSLDARTYHLVRLAALIAMDAPPASYLANLSMAADDGVNVEDAQGVAVAIAPIVGAPRITAAAGHMLRALGLAELIQDGSAG